MKKFLKYFGFGVLIFIIYFVITSYPKLDLISGFASKSVASAHFIDNRPLNLIEKTDNDIPLVKKASNRIDDKNLWATSSVFGLKERKAIYRKGLGCTLIDDTFDVNTPYLVPHRAKTKTSLFPKGNVKKDTVFANIDYKKLQTALNNAFDAKGKSTKKTRSVLVVYNDHIIAEKYAEGFNENSKILGWSMTKSLTATLYGILQHQNKINITNPVNLAEWQKDERKNITYNDLLHMNSGLEWEEDYTKISDVTQMLFLAKNMGQVQAEKPSVGKPNQTWNYSSGTTNLLSLLLRKQFKTHQEYLDFWYSALLDKIGMNSALVEVDMAGNYVGSSYGWATTRDWAKFGLLYLHKGNWFGEQIFSPEWATYVATPTPTSGNRYGAHFWLNAGRKFPNVPKEMYYCSGYQGQMVAIFPNHNLVIVRMGTSEDFDFDTLLSEIIKSIKPENTKLK